MSKNYSFKFKKRFFWKTVKAIGHRYEKEIDRMDVYLEKGEIFSISQWSKYDLFLGIDWVLFTKTQMENESGQKIDLSV